MKWLRRLIAQNVILCLSLLGVSFIFLSHTHSTQELQSSQSKLIYRQRNSLRRLDRECRLLEKQKLESEIFGSLSSAVVAPKEAEKQEVMKTIRIAKREKIIRDNVLYFPELQQMWCLVPKAGSSTWSKVILEELNRDSLQLWVEPTSNISLQIIFRKNFGYIQRKTYMSALSSDSIHKILLVRHPWARLVSAYRDKLAERKARPDGMHFFQAYGARMNRAYRKDRRRNKKREPTFHEFLEYLVHTEVEDYDNHWMPITVLCGLCHVRYDQIIPVEELEEGFGVDHLERLGFNVDHTHTDLPKENSLSHNNDSSWREAFRNIPTATKVGLLRKFGEDFRLLGYSPF